MVKMLAYALVLLLFWAGVGWLRVRKPLFQGVGLRGKKQEKHCPLKKGGAGCGDAEAL